MEDLAFDLQNCFVSYIITIMLATYGLSLTFAVDLEYSINLKVFSFPSPTPSQIEQVLCAS